MEQRLNARIDPALARKLDHLRQLTGQSVTAIVKAALEAYYERLQDDQASTRDILERCGFVGCAAGSPELSSRYKADLSTSLVKKT